ncbi:exonuclease tos [Arctopsyche grandis]|uniref:exonuclease tos n=1 Tax=Arctopsyche grandis TaxID=121162 RepID=UPI00406D891E
MGVTGLLGFAGAASRPASASQLAGETAAIDAYCWLHRGAFSCADKLARGEHTDQHIRYCMKYVYMLLSHNIKPILVFDGRHLPAKLLTEEKRRESRNAAKKRAAELLRMGKVEEAKTHMRRSVDITHEMALDLIKECRKMNVDCIVAPYEADAQLAYLNRKNIAQFVITEDSDLLLFGCNKVFFKMDLNGNGVLMESAKLPLVMKCPYEKYRFDKFRQMCILSGCDYLASLPGIGLAKARQFINATQDPDISNALKKIPSFFNKSSLQVTDEYRDAFLKAEATFKHQYVYDPIDRAMIPLNSLEDEGTDPQHCTNAGTLLDVDVAFQLAVGNLDPFTLKQMDNWHPDDKSLKPTGAKTNQWSQFSIAPHKSMWSKDYTEHVKENSKKDNSFISAIAIPTTRLLKSKIINTPTINENESLTIKDLKAMYCKEPAKKKAKLIVSETQNIDDDFDSVDVHKLLTSPLRSVGNQKSCEESAHAEEQTSPILQTSERTYKRMMKSGSFSKLKRLSKFQRTVVDENNIVQSRFFNMETPDSSSENCLEINVNNCESPIDINGESSIKKISHPSNNMSSVVSSCEGDEVISENSIDISGEASLNKISHPSNNISNAVSSCEGDLIISERRDKSTHTNSKLPQIMISPSRNPFKKNALLDTDEILMDRKYVVDLPTPGCSQTSSEDTIDLSEDKTVVVNKLVNLECPKKREVEKKITKPQNTLCRRPGLAKKSSVLTSQQTLLSVFGFQKKCKLKH